LKRISLQFLGVIDDHSEIVPWTVPEFYEEEKGRLVAPLHFLFAATRAESACRDQVANAANQRPLSRACSGGRHINCDPGDLDAFKVALASTKNASQRIYLGSGIYVDAPLLYYNGGFHNLA